MRRKPAYLSHQNSELQSSNTDNKLMGNKVNDKMLTKTEILLDEQASVENVSDDGSESRIRASSYDNLNH